MKLLSSPGSGLVAGAAVAPRASELILAVSLAVEQRLTVEQIAQTFAVHPVAVRQPHRGGEEG